MNYKVVPGERTHVVLNQHGLRIATTGCENDAQRIARALEFQELYERASCGGQVPPSVVAIIGESSPRTIFMGNQEAKIDLSDSEFHAVIKGWSPNIEAARTLVSALQPFIRDAFKSGLNKLSLEFERKEVTLS